MVQERKRGTEITKWSEVLSNNKNCVDYKLEWVRLELALVCRRRPA